MLGAEFDGLDLVLIGTMQRSIVGNPKTNLTFALKQNPGRNRFTVAKEKGVWISRGIVEQRSTRRGLAPLDPERNFLRKFEGR